jgi:hypothetical protein
VEPDATNYELAEAWEPVPGNPGAATCGTDFTITAAAEDPSRFFVLHCPTGDTILRAAIPIEEHHYDGFSELKMLLAHALLTHDLDDRVSDLDGLNDWYDSVEPAAASAYAQFEAELAELLANRPGITAAELRAAKQEAEVTWLVRGFLKLGFGTKLGGREKIGKGLKVLITLGQLERGEATVFGPAQGPPVTALILTEEPDDSILEKANAADLKRARIIFGWELASLSWAEKVNKLIFEANLDGHQVLFIDNFSRAARVEDEAGPESARAAELLLDKAKPAGIAVIIDWHHKKGRDSIENKSRGGTGLAGAMDINVEMERIGGRDSRRRRLTAQGRMRATHWTRVVELSDEGTEYTDVTDTAEVEVPDPDAQRRWTDIELLRQTGTVTAEQFKVLIDKSLSTAKRRLAELVDEGLAERHNPGGVREPITYSAVVAGHVVGHKGMNNVNSNGSDSGESA